MKDNALVISNKSLPLESFYHAFLETPSIVDLSFGIFPQSYISMQRCIPGCFPNTQMLYATWCIGSWTKIVIKYYMIYFLAYLDSPNNQIKTTKYRISSLNVIEYWFEDWSWISHTTVFKHSNNKYFLKYHTVEKTWKQYESSYYTHQSVAGSQYVVMDVYTSTRSLLKHIIVRSEKHIILFLRSLFKVLENKNVLFTN